ncbi:MAG: DUF4178 domain-containing protein [Chloroflexota bacterium]
MITQTRSALTRLECPNCGSPIDQFNPTSQAIVCQTCGSHVTVGVEELEILSPGKKLPPAPRPINLGDQATIGGTEYVVLGRVMYRGVDEGVAFTWNEWQLGGDDGRILWLSLDEKGWSLSRKIRFREPVNPRSVVMLNVGDGQKAFFHERYTAQIYGAEGELTWRAKPGSSMLFADGAGKGAKYSISKSPKELSLYQGKEVSEMALAKAFGNDAWLKMVTRYKERRSAYNRSAVMALVASVIAFVIAGIVSFTGVREEPITVDLRNEGDTESFDVDFRTQRPAIVSVQLDGTLPQNTSVDIDVGITSPDGTTQDLFVQELWHETGRDEDGVWVSRSYRTSDMFVPTQSGKHVFDVSYNGTYNDDIELLFNVRRQHIMPIWFLIYGVGALIMAGILAIMASGQRPSHN